MNDFQKQRRQLVEFLYENLNLLDKSLEVLDYSYQKCQNIQISDGESPENLEAVEALTSRFARSADILTQKIFKTLFKILQEDSKTFLDMANLCEKIEIIETANELLALRELRNQIAHEYTEPDLKKVFRETLSYVPLLKKIISNAKAYIQKILPVNC